jgi:hypothetical protein
MKAPRPPAPGERAARRRVEAVYAAVDRLTVEDLQRSTVPPRDPEQRKLLLGRLERRADQNERGPLLDEARAWLRDALHSRSVSRYRAESGALGWYMEGRAEDQAQVLLALEDAVSVAVAEDLLERDDAAALADPGRRLLGLAPLVATPEAPAPSLDWEPTRTDWEAASSGATSVQGGQWPRGTRMLRVAFLGTAAVIGAGAAMAWGLTEGEPWQGALVAVAVVALCWTLATYRNTRPERR